MIEIFEQVVAVQIKMAGETDYRQFTSEHELASAYLNDGQIKQVIQMFEHVVHKSQGSTLAQHRILGPSALHNTKVKGQVLARILVSRNRKYEGRYK